MCDVLYYHYRTLTKVPLIPPTPRHRRGGNDGWRLCQDRNRPTQTSHMLLMHIFLHTSVVQANRPVALQQDMDNIGKRANLSTKTPALLTGQRLSLDFFFFSAQVRKPCIGFSHFTLKLTTLRSCGRLRTKKKNTPLQRREWSSRNDKRHLFTTRHTPITRDRQGAVPPPAPQPPRK